MATWHQGRPRLKLYHDTLWTVCIDPPNDMMALMTFTTKALAEVYMRNLAANNPAVHKYAYMVKPASETIYG
jgi:hypothetical protein